MSKTLVIQSHRSPLPYSWLCPCLDSVRHWSESNQYAYRFLNDELFDAVADDLLEKLTHQKLLQQALREGSETVVWLDADFLIFDPLGFVLPEGPYAVGREVWVQHDQDGRQKVYKKVHNAFLMSRKGDSFLDFYADTAERLLAQIHKIDELNARLEGIRLLKSTEVDILEDGSLDLPDSVLKQLDFTVCSVHYGFNLSSKKQTERILRAMKRPAATEKVLSRIARWRETCPELVLRSTFIVGFPGETDAEFEQSLEFVEKMSFSRLHVFRYSIREGTPAARMPQQVHGDVARGRSARMHQLAAKLENRFNSSLIGRTLPVLWETAEDHGDFLRWSGLTPNYVRITTDTVLDRDMLNTVTPTDITEVVPGGVVGRVRNSEF